jgi:hypothetical protein
VLADLLVLLAAVAVAVDSPPRSLFQAEDRDRPQEMQYGTLLAEAPLRSMAAS